MSTVIFDLDHTLLNTTEFKVALAQSLGLTAEQFFQAYEGFLNDNGMFRPDDFLQGEEPAKRTAFMAVLKKLRSFLYPDVMHNLQRLHTDGMSIVVLTYGDQAWQEQKLAALHFPDFVQTIATEHPKETVVAKFAASGSVYYVDDKATELDAVKVAFPDTHCYWMMRPEGKYKHSSPSVAHHTIYSLDEFTINT